MRVVSLLYPVSYQSVSCRLSYYIYHAVIPPPSHCFGWDFSGTDLGLQNLPLLVLLHHSRLFTVLHCDCLVMQYMKMLRSLLPINLLGLPSIHLFQASFLYPSFPLPHSPSLFLGFSHQSLLYSPLPSILLCSLSIGLACLLFLFSFLYISDFFFDSRDTALYYLRFLPFPSLYF